MCTLLINIPDLKTKSRRLRNANITYFIIRYKGSVVKTGLLAYDI